MKPFALGAVLRYRQQLEDAARRELHQALQAEARLRTALRHAQAELAELYAGLERDQARGTTADRLLLYEHRIDLVREQEQRRQRDVARQQEQVAQQRQLLIKASTDRKVLEKLREQQDAAYRRHLERKETEMLDEIAVLSHERRQHSG